MPHIKNLSPKETEAWKMIEKFMMEHDKSMMGLYSKDIDSVLVLDGLFIGAVTGFVVPAYVLLQVDNTAASVAILESISSQLQSFVYSAPFLNNTISGISSPAFEPATISRWVTVLWSTSLIISLASAMLGILAKQWISEYLAWHERTASPWTNIIVRQARFEAWEQWPTAIIIATIPALLEFAITLFIAAFVIFSWKLDRTLAISVTVAAAVYLMIISALISLPLLSKRCPYKSPTALACVITIHTAGGYLLAVPRLLSTPGDVKRWAQGLPSAVWTGVYSGSKWSLESSRSAGEGLQRTWDLVTKDVGSTTLQSLTWRCRSKYPALRSELSHTRLSQKLAGNLSCAEIHSESKLFDDPALDRSRSSSNTIVSEIHKFSLLFDAFSWMLDASLYSACRGDIAICVGTLYQPNMVDFSRDFDLYESYTAGDEKALSEDALQRAAIEALLKSSYFHGVKNLATWYIASSKQPCSKVLTPIGSNVTLTKELRNTLVSFYSPQRLGSEEPMSISRRDARRPGNISQNFALNPGLVDLKWKQRRLLGLFFASQIRASIVDILHFIAERHHDVMPSSSPHFLKQVELSSHAASLLDLFKHQVAEMLCAVRYIALNQRPEERIRGIIDLFPDLRVLLDVWCEIYNHPHRTDFDGLFPGLRSSLLDIVLSRVNAVYILVDGPDSTASWTAASNTPATAKYAVDIITRYLLNSTSSQEDLHAYAWIVDGSINRMKNPTGLQDYLDGGCLRNMTNALEIALKNRWRNGGSYSSLTWVEGIMSQDGRLRTATYLRETHSDDFRKFVGVILASKMLIDDPKGCITQLSELYEQTETK